MNEKLLFFNSGLGETEEILAALDDKGDEIFLLFNFGTDGAKCLIKFHSAVVPLNFLPQYTVEVERYKFLSPKESYFQSPLMSIYDAASRQNLFYSMTQD